MYNLDIFCCVANFANMRSTRVFFYLQQSFTGIYKQTSSLHVLTLSFPEFNIKRLA